MLFQYGDFIGASGKKLKWKIECDALDNNDWETIASIALDIVSPFSKVIGVPNGGLKLATILSRYQQEDANRYLFVDDVYTTGFSLNRCVNEFKIPNWEGFVVFSRGILPSNVKSLFQLNTNY